MWVIWRLLSLRNNSTQKLHESLPPQFLQNIASIGFVEPHAAQTVESSRVPHLMQCFAPLRSCAPHFRHHPDPRVVSTGLGGARELGENTSVRITTSPTVAILSWGTSNSLERSRSSSIVLNCSLSTDNNSDLISPPSVGIAFLTLPTRIP